MNPRKQPRQSAPRKMGECWNSLTCIAITSLPATRERLRSIMTEESCCPPTPQRQNLNLTSSAELITSSTQHRT